MSSMKWKFFILNFSIFSYIFIFFQECPLTLAFLFPSSNIFPNPAKYFHPMIRSQMNDFKGSGHLKKRRLVFPVRLSDNENETDEFMQIMQMETIDIKLELQRRGAEHRDLFEKKDLAKRLLQVKKQDTLRKDYNTGIDQAIDTELPIDEVIAELKLLGCKVSNLWGQDRMRRELARARQVAEISTQDRSDHPDQVVTKPTDIAKEDIVNDPPQKTMEPKIDKEALFLEISSMESETIMDELEKRGITFSVLDTKPTLVNLLLDARTKEPTSFPAQVQLEKEVDKKQSPQKEIKEASFFNSLLEDASYLSTRQLLTRLDSLNIEYDLFMSRQELERMYANEMVKNGASKGPNMPRKKQASVGKPKEYEAEQQIGQRPFRNYDEAYNWVLHLTKRQICQELEARGIEADHMQSTKTLAVILADELMLEVNLTSPEIHQATTTKKKYTFNDLLERSLDLDKNSLIEEFKSVGAEFKEDIAQSDLARQLAQLKFWEQFGDLDEEDSTRPQTALRVVARKLWKVCLAIHDLLIQPILEDLSEAGSPIGNLLKGLRNACSEYFSKGKRVILLSAANTCMAAVNSLARWAGGTVVPPRYVIFLCTSVGLLARRGLWVPGFVLLLIRFIRTEGGDESGVESSFSKDGQREDIGSESQQQTSFTQ